MCLVFFGVFVVVLSAQQMLLLCQGVNEMRKDGEPAVWTHHKQSFQGESLTVNACPQLTTLIHISLSHASPNQSIRTICKFTPALSSTRGPAQPQIWTKGLKLAWSKTKPKKKQNTTPVSWESTKKTAFILAQLWEMMQQGEHMP